MAQVPGYVNTYLQTFVGHNWLVIEICILSFCNKIYKTAGLKLYFFIYKDCMFWTMCLCQVDKLQHKFKVDTITYFLFGKFLQITTALELLYLVEFLALLINVSKLQYPELYVWQNKNISYYYPYELIVTRVQQNFRSSTFQQHETYVHS